MEINLQQELKKVEKEINEGSYKYGLDWFVYNDHAVKLRSTKHHLESLIKLFSKE